MNPIARAGLCFAAVAILSIGTAFAADDCTVATNTVTFGNYDGSGNVAVTMLQLSNVAWETNRELQLNTADAKIQNDAQAMSKYWGREYEKGWAPHL